jgi:hypothetical protein
VSYADDLKHPLWQQKRLEVFQRAGFRCQRCGTAERELHAHHRIYLKGRRPWEYEDALLECLCNICHDLAHAEREELDWIVAHQMTGTVPLLTEAVVAALSGEHAGPAMPPRARDALRKLGGALATGDPSALVDAHNALQDLIDEAIDLRRGAGGTESRRAA